MFLNADAIKSSTPKMTVVPVPEWGGEGAEVMVRSMSGTHRFALEQILAAEADLDIRPPLVAFTLCDADGNLLFADAGEAIAVLAAKNNVALKRVFDAAFALNKLDRKSVDELEKN